MKFEQASEDKISQNDDNVKRNRTVRHCCEEKNKTVPRKVCGNIRRENGDSTKKGNGKKIRIQGHGKFEKESEDEI